MLQVRLVVKIHLLLIFKYIKSNLEGKSCEALRVNAFIKSSTPPMSPV